MTEREYIEQQARTLGVEIAGKLTRSRDNEKNSLEVCFVDEAGKLYILCHCIITVQGPDGKVC